MSGIRRVARSRDKRTEVQLQENLKASTASEAEQYAEDAKLDANQYTDQETTKAVNDANDYADSAASTAETNAKSYADGLVNLGGPTADRPGTPEDYMMYFDTDLGYPIWYDGTDWVDSQGTVV